MLWWLVGGGADVNIYPAGFIKNIILSCIILLSYLIFCKEDAVVLMYSFTNTNGLQESTESFQACYKHWLSFEMRAGIAHFLASGGGVWTRWSSSIRVLE